MKIRLKKIGDLLSPALPCDAEYTDKLKQGEIIEVNSKRPRQAWRHDKYFALLHIVVDNTDYIKVEQVLTLIKLKLGHFETIINTNGKVVYKEKSISFGSMDEDTFRIFYNDTVNVVLRDFLTNWEDEDIQTAIDEVVRF
jgi:hypothetical protein